MAKKKHQGRSRRRSSDAGSGGASRREQRAQPRSVAINRRGNLPDAPAYAPTPDGESLWLWHAPKVQRPDGSFHVDPDAAFAVLNDFHYGAGEKVLGGKSGIARRLGTFRNSTVRLVLEYEAYDSRTNRRVRRIEEHQMQLGERPRVDLFGHKSRVGDVMRKDLQKAYRKEKRRLTRGSTAWYLVSMRIVKVGTRKRSASAPTSAPRKSRAAKKAPKKTARRAAQKATRKSAKKSPPKKKRRR